MTKGLPVASHPFRRIVITGANGAGKTHFAQQVADARPQAALIHYDALKLTTDWRERPREDSQQALATAIAAPDWIVEGGPSMLRTALPHADLVVWLRPAPLMRTWRLLLRPLRHRGQTRPELPPGNRDHLWAQWRFGIRSLVRGPAMHRTIRQTLDQHPQIARVILHSAADQAAIHRALLAAKD